MIEKAYAKINLTLDVKNIREDRYHEIESIMIPIEFHDTLEIGLLPKGTTDDFVVCDDFSLKVSKYNLVHKMIDICREIYGFERRLNVSIHKNIYLQGGLGGGSADAAAIFRAIIKIFKLNPTEEEIKKICLTIGSDVLFQFYNKPALVKGKGDFIEFIDININPYVLLVKPLSGNSSKNIFEKSDEMILKHVDSYLLLDDLKRGDLLNLKGKNINSLYEVSKELNKDMEEIKALLEKYDFELIGMTGSGSTFYALTNDLKKAKKAAKDIYKNGYNIDITKFL